ncbi:MAG: hypothetical protein SVR94_14095 [Pseudomonadota bacterium]|nr:hypothetical protein [Pseudomonadota bacterium]
MIVPITSAHFFHDNFSTQSASDRYQRLLNEQTQLNFKHELFTLLQRWFNVHYFKKLAAQYQHRLDKVNVLLTHYPQTPQGTEADWIDDEIYALILEHLSPVDYSPEFILDEF